MTESLRLAFAITLAATLHFAAHSQSAGINRTINVLTIKAIQEQQQIINKQQKQIKGLLKRVEKPEQK